MAEHAPRLAPESDVLELGAGEARTLVALAAADGHRGTAVDFSAEALRGARDLAAAHDVALDLVEADVRTWTPDRQWDAVIVTFVQLLPDERPDFYRTMRQAVRPGGWILGQWFRPDHLTGDYARIGPSAADRMVPVEELRTHFADDTLAVCAARDVTLDEGDVLTGPAATACLAARREEDGGDG